MGVIIFSNGTIDRELSARIGKASGAFNQLSNIWKKRNVQTNTNIRIYKAAVLTILLYGSEVWNITKKQQQRLEVFHQRCLIRILRINWYHRTRNVDVLERARINPIDRKHKDRKQREMIRHKREFLGAGHSND
jgi:hypothetical protein